MKTLHESHGRIKETRGDKRVVTLIREGWGSSGYYPGEVLERDTPRVFPIGTHMYMDHPTAREDAEKPERSVLDLVGTLIETPRYAGAESVSVAEVYDHWKPVINAVADDVGLSIRALGEIEENWEGAGKKGNRITALTEGISVDYVTQAGAGGKVGALIESARQAVPADHPDYPEFQAELNALLREGGEGRFLDFIKSVAKKGNFQVPEFTESGSGRQSTEGGSMDPEKALSEAQDRIRQLEGEVKEKSDLADKEKDRADRAEDSLLLNEASKVVIGVVGEIKGLPKRAAKRAAEAALRGDLPTDSEGKLIKEKLEESAKSAAKAEVEYLSETTGRSVEGFGESPEDDLSILGEKQSKEDEALDKQLEETLTEAFGLPEKVAQHAVKGR
jgi:hypothetical protein